MTMRRAAIDHMLRAAGDLTGEKRFVLVGSAALVAWFTHVPEGMAMTAEIDIFAVDATDPDEVSFELEGVLGQQTAFHQTHGYFVDGVGPETARLPEDWRDRSITYGGPSTNGVVAIIPAPDDIAVAKLVRCSERDIRFIADGVAAGLIDIDTVVARAETLRIEDLQQGKMSDKIAILLGGIKSPSRS